MVVSWLLHVSWQNEYYCLLKLCGSARKRGKTWNGKMVKQNALLFFLVKKQNKQKWLEWGEDMVRGIG